MSINSNMKLVLGKVPGALGTVWQYARRTSKRDVIPIEFAPFVDVETLALDQNDEHEDDDDGDTFKETYLVRVPATANIKVGGQMKHPDAPNPIYHVKQLVSSGIGTDRFMISRSRRDLLGSLRGGGFN